MKLEPTIRMRAMISGVWRRFGVHVFEGKITLDDMARMEESGDVWNKKNPGRLVELVIIYPSDAKMTSEERVRMAAVIKRWEGIRNASATVILASGLLGAMHRSVLTGMLMIAPPPHPSKVFGVTADSVKYLAPYVQALCGPEATCVDLLAAVNDLCATFRTGREGSPRSADDSRNRTTSR